MSKRVLVAVKPIKFKPDNGNELDYSEFHLLTRLNGRDGSAGIVTQPYKFGTSAEAAKWAHLLQAGTAERPVFVSVECEFEEVSDGKGKARIDLVAIAPASQSKAA